jgi:hypothetical protein
MAKLVVNYPNMAEGTELDIPPHGLFVNGESYDVDWLDEDTVLGEPIVTKAKKKSDPKEGE